MGNRWTRWLAAVLLISACSQGTLTRVVRTDGTAVVGELVAARPDAVVVKIADGTSLTIPRSVIRSIESAPANAAAPAASGSSANAGASTAASGGKAAASGGTSGAGAPAVSAGGGATSGSSGATSGGKTGTTTGATGKAGNASSSGTAAGGSSAGGNAANTAAGGGNATPAMREAIAPSGTTLELALNTALASDSSAVDDKVDAVLRAPIIINGAEVLGAGATAHGTVTEATPSAKAAGRGRLAVRFDSIELGTKSLAIQAAPVRWEASGVTKRAEPEPRGFFKKVVSKTKKGLRIGEEDKERGSAEIRLAAGAIVRIRLEQPAHIAP